MKTTPPRFSPLSLGLLLAFGSLQMLPTGARAQDAAQRVEITGSNIRRVDAETPSPVQVITAQELKASGFTSTQEVLHNITANGQGTLSQGFSGAFATGAAGIALRGLTVGATLVLIDGHRMAPFPVGDDGQRSFVDISNIPFDAVERIEILKDGASSVYGSDAIAGVVNIILKKSFTGATIGADLGTSGHRDGSTAHVTGIWGVGDLVADGRNFYVSAELRKQRQIRYADRPGPLTQSDYSAQGGYNLTPGAVNPLTGSTPRSSSTGYIVAPDGTAYFLPGCDATRLAASQCTYTDTWSQVQPPTENLNLVARYTQNLPADWQLSVQGSYFRSKAQQVAGPQRAFSGGFQGLTSGPGVVPTLLTPIAPTSLPSTHPNFPQSAAAAGVTAGDLRYTFLNLGPLTTDTDAEATRLIADLQGRLGAWDLTASAGLTRVGLKVVNRNYVNPTNLQAALNSTTDPFLIGQPNSAALNAFVAPVLVNNDVSKLNFIHLGAGRDLADLGGGPLAAAFGIDYFERTQNALAPADVANGLVPNGNNNFTVGKQKVRSAYGELVAPFTKQFSVEGAIRYDHYNLSGGKASPKVGFKFTPVPEFALRGTASRGFRAPSPAENGQAGQTFFAGNFTDPVLCANGGGDPAAPGNFPSECAFPIASVQGTTPTLKPETSTAFTLGLIYEPSRDLSLSVDFYQIKVKDQIITDQTSTTLVRGTNFTPIPQVQPDGSTALVVPPVAPIAYQSAGYINANSTTTNGVDIGVRFRRKLEGIGEWKTEFMWSYTNKYDITIDGVTYKLAGTHGPFIVSGDTGNPRSRIQWSNTLSRDDWSITGTFNFVGGYNVTDPSSGIPDCLSGLRDSGGAAGNVYAGVLANDQIPSQNMCKVASFTTFDLYGRYQVTKNLEIHGSITNLFNRRFPTDWSTYAASNAYAPYNPSLHSAGAIGRYFNIGASYKF